MKVEECDMEKQSHQTLHVGKLKGAIFEKETLYGFVLKFMVVIRSNVWKTKASKIFRRYNMEHDQIRFEKESTSS